MLYLQLQAFLAIILLCSWLTTTPQFMCRYNDVIELFSGTGRICQLALAAGYFAIAHDRDYDPHGGPEGSCMDLNKDAGYLHPVYNNVPIPLKP